MLLQMPKKRPKKNIKKNNVKNILKSKKTQSWHKTILKFYDLFMNKQLLEKSYFFNIFYVKLMVPLCFFMISSNAFVNFS